MKEHVLLMAIASVGFSGLFSIYNDVKVHQELQSPRHILETTEGAILEKILGNVYEPMSITPIQGGNSVQVDVLEFTDQDLFSIDFGNGYHFILEKPDCTFQYLEPGVYKVQLFKNEQLIHAKQLEVTVTDHQNIAMQS